MNKQWEALDQVEKGAKEAELAQPKCGVGFDLPPQLGLPFPSFPFPFFLSFSLFRAGLPHFQSVVHFTWSPIAKPAYRFIHPHLKIMWQAHDPAALLPLSWVHLVHSPSCPACFYFKKTACLTCDLLPLSLPCFFSSSFTSTKNPEKNKATLRLLQAP